MVLSMLFICLFMPQTIIEIVFNPYGGPPVTGPGLAEPNPKGQYGVEIVEGEPWR